MSKRITVSQGMRGWYAVLIDDVSPIRSGIGSYRTREQAMQSCTNHCCLESGTLRVNRIGHRT